MKNKKLMGDALLLLTAFIWGTAFVFQRAGMETIEPITFNAARMFLAAVVVGFVAFGMGRKEKKDTADKTEKQRDKDCLTGGICCGCVLAIASILQQTGLVYTTAGKAGFITAMYMLLVPVISFVFLKRKNTWLVWCAVLLGVTGMYFLCITEEFRLSRGDTLVGLCALFFSLHILCCDHFAQKADPVRISAIQFATAALISAVAAGIVEEPDIGKLLSALGAIVYCGIVSGGIGYTLQITAQKYTEPATASLLMSMESVFAVIAGAIVLREQMSKRELIGCLLMFAAILLVQIREVRTEVVRTGE
ncbi:MAG: DMT family transporter [Lachnospiraceae bacterium]|nr:DMT family transporter [Lachnospiraceae bacterium]